jgi:branched-chain amino acid transport system permease protein
MRLRARILLGVLLACAGALVPILVTQPAYLDLAVLSAFYLLLAASWNLLAGFTGQYSFAHAALAGVGAYSAILVEETLGVSALAALPLAGLLTAAVGVVLGLFSLRVRGVYLSLVTFAFAGAFGVWATGARHVTGGANGHEADIIYLGIDKDPYVWLGLVLVIVYFALQSLILSGRWGVFMTAVRDREEVAAGLGVRTMRVRVAVFVFTAFWAGVAGAFYAGYIGIASPSIGHLTEMGTIVAMAVVGGLGAPLGPIAGVLILQITRFEVSGFGAEYTLLIFAGITLAVIVVVPNGVVGLIESVAQRVRAPQRRWREDASEAQG